MLGNSIDFLRAVDFTLYNILCCVPHMTVKHFTTDTGIPSIVYHYLSFNYKKFNITWRKALSYAINYTYVLEEIRPHDAIRANSPISPGFGLSYNNSVRGADYNLTLARETMVSMGYGNMSWSDAEWIGIAEGTSPFREVGYFFGPLFNSVREAIGLALLDWFKLIGVYLYEFDPCDPFDPWCFSFNFDELDLYNIGWAPDYFSPFNMLDPLFNPNSRSNIALVNDTKFNAMIALALNTTDKDARYEIYKNIQWYISEVGYFHAPLYHKKIIFVHSADLYGVPYNAMQKLEVYGIRRA